MNTANQFFASTMGVLPLEPETIATVALMSSAPTDARVRKYDRLIKEIKRATGLALGVDNLDTHFEVLCIRAAHHSQAALLNWVKNSIHSTEVNSPTFTVDKGFSSDGSTSYINTNFNPNDGHTNWSINDNSCISGYLDIDHSNPINRALIGSRAGTRYDIFTLSSTAVGFQYDNNQNGASPAGSSFTVENGLSMGATQRSVSTEYEIRSNNLTGTVTETSTGISNQPLYELSYSLTGGTPSLFATTEMKTAFTLIGKSGVDLLKVYNGLQFYINSL